MRGWAYAYVSDLQTRRLGVHRRYHVPHDRLDVETPAPIVDQRKNAENDFAPYLASSAQLQRRNLPYRPSAQLICALTLPQLARNASVRCSARGSSGRGWRARCTPGYDPGCAKTLKGRRRRGILFPGYICDGSRTEQLWQNNSRARRFAKSSNRTNDNTSATMRATSGA